jgi:hypothetical protein
MINKDQMQAVVFQAIDRVNEVLLDEHALTKAAGTVLLGAGAQLDSMGFVNFVVALEELAAQETGLNLNLAEALNAKDSVAPPTLTVAGLTDFLFTLAQAGEPKANG